MPAPWSMRPSIGLKRTATVEELGVTLTVNGARLVGESGRGLALLPFAAVYGHHPLVAVADDHPIAHDRGESGGLRAHGLGGEIKDALRGGMRPLRSPWQSELGCSPSRAKAISLRPTSSSISSTA